MKPRFLADQNLSPKTVAFLRELGFEAVRVNEVGLAAATDLQVAEYARNNGFVILTLDKDFGQIYFFSRVSSGTIIVRSSSPSVENINSLLKSLLKRIEASRLQKSLVLVTESGYRIMENPQE